MAYVYTDVHHYSQWIKETMMELEDKKMLEMWLGVNFYVLNRLDHITD